MGKQEDMEKFEKELIEIGYCYARKERFYADKIHRDLCYCINSTNYALVASIYSGDNKWMLDAFYRPDSDQAPSHLPFLVKHVSGSPGDFSLDSFKKAQVNTVKYLENEFISEATKNLQLPKVLTDLLR